jgi:DNA polymerase I-like protein with 3'-5' exonuclease and polymerase domains
MTEPASSELPLLIPEQMAPPMNPTLVVDGAGLDKVSKFLSRVVLDPGPAQSAAGLDVETDIQANFLEQRLRTIQLGNRDEQYCIDLLAFAETEERMKSQQGFRKTAKCFEPIVNTLRPFLDSPCLLKIGHNLQFEYEMLSWNLGLYVWNLWCTYTVEKLHYAGLVPFKRSGFWALDDLIARYMAKKIDKTLQGSFDLKTPLTPQQVMYSCLDTRLPLGLYFMQRKRAVDERYYDVCQIENNYIPANGDMHVTGFRVAQDKWRVLADEATAKHKEYIKELDTHFLQLVGPKKLPAENLLELEQKWRALADRGPEELEYHNQAKMAGQILSKKQEWRAKRDELEDARLLLKKKAGEEYKEASKYATWFKKEGAKMEGEACIVYSSPKQLLEALKKVRGLKDIEDTNDKTLSKLEKEFPIIKAVSNYRTTEKQISSFGENLLDFVNPITGRLHSRHDALGAETGRMSSSKPNLQQIPKDPRYRACFVVQPGFKMGTLDFDGCEVRIMTEESGDPAWIEALNNGWDIHSVVAEKMQPEEWAKAAVADACAFVAAHAKCECPEHKHIRNNSKSINFGLAYGLTALGLADQLNITEERAQALLNLWHASNPVLSAALKKWARPHRHLEKQEISPAGAACSKCRTGIGARSWSPRATRNTRKGSRHHRGRSSGSGRPCSTRSLVKDAITRSKEPMLLPQSSRWAVGLTITTLRTSGTTAAQTRSKPSFAISFTTKRCSSLPSPRSTRLLEWQRIA